MHACATPQHRTTPENLRPLKKTRRSLAPGIYTFTPRRLDLDAPVTSLRIPPVPPLAPNHPDDAQAAFHDLCLSTN